MSIETQVGGDGLRTFATARHPHMAVMLADTAAREPAKLAFVDERRSVDWATFAAEVDALAGRLAACGVRAGDRVALLFGNSIAYTVALWAAWRVRAIVVPVNGRLLATEMVPLVADAETALLLGGGSLQDAAEQVAAALGVRLALENGDGRLLAELEPGMPPEPVGWSADDPAAIMYTSGTTGRPKGVVVTHGNLVQNSRTCIDVIGRRAGDVELIAVPQFNITGLASQTVPVVDSGMTAVLLPRFETSSVLEAIALRSATSTVLAPTMWWRLLEDPGLRSADVSSLRLALFGGAPMPTALLRRMRDAFAGATFGNGYGMTETCSMVTYIGGDEVFQQIDSVGRPLPITELRVVDPTGNDVAEGETGELWFRGSQCSRGYWRNDEATRELFAEGGWLRTGDAGLVRTGGYVVLRDRLKDVIKRGGESVFSFEVENVLHQHPAVLEAAVVGVPDEIYGEQVAAVVVCKPGNEIAPDEVIDFCRTHMARFKVPRRIAFVDALPRNAGGKVLKPQLREILEAS